MIIIIIVVFISIWARCNWPQLLRCPCQRSFCLFVFCSCLFFFFGEANSNNEKNTNELWMYLEKYVLRWLDWIFLGLSIYYIAIKKDMENRLPQHTLH